MNEARFEARLKENAPQGEAAAKRSEASPKRRTPSYPRLPRGVKAYAFFASQEEAYASHGKRAKVEGRLREKEEKEEKGRKRKIEERLEAREEERERKGRVTVRTWEWEAITPQEEENKRRGRKT